MKKLTAVDLGMLYHDWVARLYTSDHAGIVPGRAREEISWDTYSKEWHREYGPARWVNAGAREVRGRLILETARGRVIDLPADEAAVGLLALQSGAPDDLIDALVGLDATGAWGSELGRELRRALKEQGYTVKRSKKSVYGRKNPYDDMDIRDLCPGVDLLAQFEQDYPQSAAGELEITQADRLYHGRNVIWRGTEGEMIRMEKQYLRPMMGNIWDACKLAGIAAALQEWPEPIVLDPGYGVPSVICLDAVKESIEYEGEPDNVVLTTGDEELDRYLVDPDEVLEDYEDPEEARKELDERLQEAVDNDEGDLGAIEFQVRNGNHRTFGALLSGEPYVWLIVDDNTLQDLKRHPDREGNQRIADALE